MKNYELTYMVLPSLTETEKKEVSEKIKNFLKQEEGVLIREQEEEKKESNIIKTLTFSLSAEKIKNFEKKIKSEDKIVRHIIIKKKAENKKIIAPKRKEIFPGSRQPTKEKVELKEIDKKIDEILNE